MIRTTIPLNHCGIAFSTFGTIFSPLDRRKFFYFEPSLDRFVRIDPFETTLTGLEYEAWLPTRIEKVMEVLGRKEQFSDYKDFRRMARVTENVLYLTAAKVNGKHYGLNHALHFLSFDGDAWDRKFRRVKPELPIEIAMDVVRLRTMGVTQRDREIESTLNLFRRFLAGPLIKQVVAAEGHCFDFTEAREKRHAVIWNLGKTTYFSKEQRDALAGLIFVMENDV